MSKKNVAELLVDTLVQAGVKNIYGLAGDSLNGTICLSEVHLAEHLLDAPLTCQVIT